MSYFDEVYIKRLNRKGKTRQERISTIKENNFDNSKLQKSQYKAIIYKINDDNANILCDLQPTKHNQDKILSNVLISRNEKIFGTGDIFYTQQQISDLVYQKIWLVCFVDDDITRGYQSYQVIELDNIIQICDEYGQTQHVVPVKFVSETSSFVQDTFQSSKNTATYREPFEHKKIITKDFDFLKKTLYFKYKDKGWKISGINNIDINNVSYISYEEVLIKPPEPKTSEEILVGENTNFFLNHD